MANSGTVRPDVDRVSILGVGIDAITISAAITHITDVAADPTSASRYVVKPYVEFLDRAATRPELQELLNGAYLSLPDGVAAIWAAHYLYAGPHGAWRFWRTLSLIVLNPSTLAWPLPEKIAGINFTLPLLETAASKHLRVFLIGQPRTAHSGTVAIAHTATTLTQKIPGLIIAGTRSGRDELSTTGKVTDGWMSQTATDIAACKPDIILVGMGFPLQERVIAQLCEKIAHGIFIGEGGTFDYEAFGGSRPKAPTRIQRVGLEWLWRLGLEPKRLIRQLAVPRFIWRIWRIR
jgi:N-acetylglucosaminyldiphosphoundecaprenol N-acetyl-beta-D-mannosaminyltransferase